MQFCVYRSDCLHFQTALSLGRLLERLTEVPCMVGILPRQSLCIGLFLARQNMENCLHVKKHFRALIIRVERLSVDLAQYLCRSVCEHIGREAMA